jgi:ribosome biogenesis protein NSA2
MPQNEYIKKSIKKYGRRLDQDEKQRKKEARMSHITSKKAKKLRGLKAKLFNKERYKEKAEMKKTIKAHEIKEGEVKAKTPEKL